MMTLKQYTAFMKEEAEAQKKADEKMHRGRVQFESMSPEEQNKYQRKLEANADAHDSIACDILNEYQ